MTARIFLSVLLLISSSHTTMGLSPDPLGSLVTPHDLGQHFAFNSFGSAAANNADSLLKYGKHFGRGDVGQLLPSPHQGLLSNHSAGSFMEVLEGIL